MSQEDQLQRGATPKLTFIPLPCTPAAADAVISTRTSPIVVATGRAIVQVQEARQTLGSSAVHLTWTQTRMPETPDWVYSLLWWGIGRYWHIAQQACHPADTGVPEIQAALKAKVPCFALSRAPTAQIADGAAVYPYRRAWEIAGGWHGVARLWGCLLVGDRCGAGAWAQQFCDDARRQYAIAGLEPEYQQVIYTWSRALMNAITLSDEQEQTAVALGLPQHLRTLAQHMQPVAAAFAMGEAAVRAQRRSSDYIAPCDADEAHMAYLLDEHAAKPSEATTAGATQPEYLVFTPAHAVSGITHYLGRVSGEQALRLAAPPEPRRGAQVAAIGLGTASVITLAARATWKPVRVCARAGLAGAGLAGVGLVWGHLAAKSIVSDLVQGIQAM